MATRLRGRWGGTTMCFMDPLGVASRRLPRLAALILAVLATTVLTTTATARSTVVSPGFYRSALNEQKAYDRLYDQVLVDPKTAAVTRGLLARLPVPEAQVTSNLRLVLPPETVRDLTERQIDAVVGYLGGKRDALDLTVDLRPVLANLNGLAQIYFGDLVASVQNRPEPDFQRFSTDLTAALSAVVAGHVPTGLPALPLTGAQADRAAATLVSGLPAAERDALRPAVETALRDGDVATALATVAPAVVTDRTRTAADRLRATVDGGTWNLTDALAASGNDLAALHRARAYTAVGFGLAESLAAALLVVTLVVLWLGVPRLPADACCRWAGRSPGAGCWPGSSPSRSG